MAHYASSKKPGNLLSAFKPEQEEELPERYLELKKNFLDKNNLREKLQTTWDRLIKEFANETAEIEQIGPNIIPQVEFEDISKNGGKFPEEILGEIHKRGVVVIRNVIPDEEALKYKEDLLKYIENHKGKIAGFPGEILFKMCSELSTSR